MKSIRIPISDADRQKRVFSEITAMSERLYDILGSYALDNQFYIHWYAVRIIDRSKVEILAEVSSEDGKVSTTGPVRFYYHRNEHTITQAYHSHVRDTLPNPNGTAMQRLVASVDQFMTRFSRLARAGYMGHADSIAYWGFNTYPDITFPSDPQRGNAMTCVVGEDNTSMTSVQEPTSARDPYRVIFKHLRG